MATWQFKFFSVKTIDLQNEMFAFRTHMQDLQEVTQEVHYENYRSERLAKGAPAPPKRTTYVFVTLTYLFIKVLSPIPQSY